MNSIHIALSLIRVPKLFVSLLFWPMVVGVLVAFFQLMVSTVFIGFVTETPERYQKRVSHQGKEANLLRALIHGTPEELPSIEVCRWLSLEDGSEEPPSANCKIAPLEVAYQTETPANFDAAELVSYLQGSTPALHICRKCTAAITISSENGKLTSDINGLRALGIYMLSDAKQTSDADSGYVAAKVSAREQLEKIRQIGGTLLLHPAGFPHPINISQATKTMLLIVNTAVIALIALWLSLKGHRKVLDYFSKNGALLPLVAACGKVQFYNAIWIITLLRVSFFLFAAVPPTVVFYLKMVPEQTMQVFARSLPEFLLWLLSMLSSLACLAIIASIAELKQRHSLASFLYRYIPLFVAFFGTAAWFVTVFQDSPLATNLQGLISIVPILGISPVLLSPLFPLSSSLLALHALISALFVIGIMRHNSKWFAAHLEEI